jgi:hypothetical protein
MNAGSRQNQRNAVDRVTDIIRLKNLGQTYEQIGEEIGISANAAKQRYYRHTRRNN